jgi:hypothetical protein
MRKRICKQIIAVAMSLTIVLGVGIGSVNTFASNTKRPLTKISVVKTKQTAKKKSKVRNPKTFVHYKTITYKKSAWIGLEKGGRWPSTKGWKSSNSSIAAITGSNWDTGHKITGKKRGKATISCTITNTNTTVADWVKGDIHKWIITVK